jgi:hypothetical protein
VKASRIAAWVLASPAACVLGLTACESAANLDVSFAHVADAQSVDADAAAPPRPTPTPTGSRCPCDQTRGEACCVVPSGLPFCAPDLEACAAADGVWLECYAPSPDSACCWHGSVGGKGAAATFRGACDGGVSACTSDADCEDAGCATQTCSGLLIGACGPTAPACP